METKTLLLTPDAPGKHRAERGRHRVDVGRHRRRGAAPVRDWMREMVPGHEHQATLPPSRQEYSSRPQPDLNESLQRRSEFVSLSHTDTTPSNRKPLLNGDESKMLYGIDSPLQAIVYPPENQPRRFCFDRSTYDEAGNRRVEYLILTDEGLRDMQQLDSHSSQAPSDQAIKVTSGVTTMIGPYLPTTGLRTKPDVARRYYEEERWPHPQPGYEGNVSFQVQRYEGGYKGLVIEDIGSEHGATTVQCNSEFVTPRDPWAGESFFQEEPPRLAPSDMRQSPHI